VPVRGRRTVFDQVPLDELAKGAATSRLLALKKGSLLDQRDDRLLTIRDPLPEIIRREEDNR
jgi:hypothetical protein